MKYKKYKILSFDCYGTLIDWEKGIWEAFQPILIFNNRNDFSKEKALKDFANLESNIQFSNPKMLYSDILNRVHKYFAKKNNLKSNNILDKEFSNSVSIWPAFSDSIDSLKKLKKDFKLVILSNISNSCFKISNKKLAVNFDAIYTAETIGSYKPNLYNFKFMINNIKNTFGESKESILHVAQSLYHDHLPAQTLGLDTVWIDRQNLSNNGDWGATKKLNNPPRIKEIFKDLKTFSSKVISS